ncbi:MAG: hypothetical protein L3J65_04930 [Robiginitomaculum sp.]|nr:hypothetical protein [Robiginitomaculum sp.]
MSTNKWTRVERLFHTAMEKPNNRRSAYLRDACDSEAEYEDCMRLVQAAQRRPGNKYRPSK